MKGESFCLCRLCFYFGSWETGLVTVQMSRRKPSDLRQNVSDDFGLPTQHERIADHTLTGNNY